MWDWSHWGQYCSLTSSVIKVNEVHQVITVVSGWTWTGCGRNLINWWMIIPQKKKQTINLKVFENFQILRPKKCFDVWCFTPDCSIRVFTSRSYASQSYIKSQSQRLENVSNSAAINKFSPWFDWSESGIVCESRRSSHSLFYCLFGSQKV